MSTLKTHNLQSPDASSVNIALAPNAGMVVAGITTYSDDVNITTDGKKLSIGAGADLQLHHTSNHSYIDDAGTGNLRLRSGTLEIQNLASSKTSAIFSSGGGQTLNFNNQTKFVTTNTGVVITGICTATSFKGDGSQLSNLPASAPVGGSASNKVFFENDKVVSVNYQITSTKNAMTAGPISINAGIAVTVPSGCSWTIV